MNRPARFPSASRSLAPWAVVEAVVLAAFGISRILYRAVLGVRFDATPPTYFIQYLKPWLVEHEFWRSLLYLHHQAPLQILIVQGATKVLGAPRAEASLQAVYATLGAVLALTLVRILRRLGASPPAACAAVCLYTVSPTTVLYENWLFYPLPTAVLVSLSMLALLRFQERGTFAAAWLFFSALACVALLRATFGSMFLCAAAGVLFLFPPLVAGSRARISIAKAAALPLLVVTLNAAKTSWLVGHSYGTALLWQNLCVKIYTHLPPYVQERLEREGRLSVAGRYGGVTVDAAEYGAFRVAHAPTGVPLLDLERMPDGGANAHALEHVLVAERYYRADALFLLRHYPESYWASVREALTTQYVTSAAYVDCLGGRENFQRVKIVRAAAEAAAVAVGPVLPNGGRRLLALVFGLPAALLYGVARLLGPRALAESERAARSAIAYAIVTIGYVSVATLLVSFGDFNRYRFDVDPLYLVLATLAVSDAGRGMARALRALGHTASSRGGDGTNGPARTIP